MRGFFVLTLNNFNVKRNYYNCLSLRNKIVKKQLYLSFNNINLQL